MNLPDHFSVTVRNYKCFGDEEAGFDTIRPVNVIIGRNNSGKSTLLEVVGQLVRPSNAFQVLGHRGATPEVFLEHAATEQQLRSIFSENASGGGIPANNHWAYGRKWVGALVKYKLEPSGAHTFVSLNPPFQHTQERDQHEKKLGARMVNPLSGKVFKHLLAERDVGPEGDSSEMNVAPNGLGATNIIQHFVNDTTLPRELVEQRLLNELNGICAPDSRADRLLVQRIREQNVWEVYLDEPTKGHVPLSHTGSGFKTVILVLVYLHLLPHLENKDIGDYIFAFEELENNMHPALQRRLLSYLRSFAAKHGCLFFLTTHSNVVIDAFSRDDSAQVVHVTHGGQQASATRVQTYIQNRGILDDLDVRASDLLQANGVIWVEGPSDRLYLNRWIELWTNGELKESVDYQCVFYGGRLLAHFSAEDPDLPSEGALLLRLNRNAAILMDSDKRSPSAKVNKTKRRIAAEISHMGGIAWITHGREVENYLPQEALAEALEVSSIPPVDQFEDFAAYLKTYASQAQARAYKRGKVEFAASICPLIQREHLLAVGGLPKRLEELCTRIRQWNNIDSSGA